MSEVIIALKVAWEGKEVWGKLMWMDDVAVCIEPRPELDGQEPKHLLVPKECVVDEIVHELRPEG